MCLLQLEYTSHLDLPSLLKGQGLGGTMGTTMMATLPWFLASLWSQKFIAGESTVSPGSSHMATHRDYMAPSGIIPVNKTARESLRVVDH